MTVDRKHVVCRACHAHCGLIVDFDGEEAVATHGDKDNPAFAGYSCIKGRRLVSQHSLDSRLLSSLRRNDDGFEQIQWGQAAEEVAEKLRRIVDEHGPDSVALYVGTFGYNNLAAHAFARAFMDALGSTSVFDAVTIDQPGKGIALATHGPWLAGPYRVDEWDGLLLVGTNPLVSLNGGLGMNPAKRLHDAKARGMQLVVIDPRRTESARQADLHLQCKPGQDPLLLAAIARILIDEGLLDHGFLAEETQGLDALRAGLEPFTPEAVALQADVPAEDIRTAARMIGTWARGSISVGTGPNMAGLGNLTEYLNLVITTLRGHWRRAGELKHTTGVFIRPAPAIAASPGPFPGWGFGRRMRVRGLEQSVVGLPTAAISDEILTPGEGRIRALLCVGGNPMLAWPDQIKTDRAMRDLDLLVCFDPRMSKTCELADYVIAPKLHYEIHGNTAAPELFGMFGAGWGFEGPYGQVSEPILEPPAGSDLCEEYAFIHRMASHLGLTLRIPSFALFGYPEERQSEAQPVPPGRALEPMDAWEAALKGAPVPIREAYADPAAHRGKMFDRPPVRVAEKPEGWEGRLNIGHPAMLEELAEAAARLTLPASEQADFPLLMVGRRLHAVYNSSWHEEPVQRRRVPRHPAYLNPEDLERYGLEHGQPVTVESARASITCVAQAADDVRPGCVSIPHSWGTRPDEPEDPLGAGGNTGRLAFNDRDFDRRTGIPRMSAIPVRVRMAPATAVAAGA